MINYLKLLLINLRHRKSKLSNNTPHKNHPVIVVSHPKCGRTWLRIMLSKLDLPFEVGFSHAKSDLKNWIHWKRYLNKRQEFVKNKKIILLIREPKDVVVSYYFHVNKRDKIFSGSFDTFIKNNYLGIKKIMSFYQVCDWYLNNYPQILVVEYEKLKEDTFQEMSRILKFLEVTKKDKEIEKVIEATQFNKLQKMEKENFVHGTIQDFLKPVKIADKDSYKVRRGKIGGYIDYLTPEEVNYCENIITKFPNPFYPKIKNNRGSN